MNDEQQAWIEAGAAVAGVLDARVNGATPPPANTPLAVAAEIIVYIAANYFTKQDDLVDWVLSLSDSSLSNTISNPLPNGSRN